MEFRISPYELRLRHPDSFLGNHSRCGILLRVDYGEKKVGYADLHPWAELGDPTLEDLKRELKAIEKGDAQPISSLLKCSLYFAETDAQARSKGISLWGCLDGIPKSHFLITHLLSLPLGRDLEEWVRRLCDGGFREVKIKVGNQSNLEIVCLKRLIPHFKEFGIRARLDFNHRLGWAGTLRYLDELLQVRAAGVSVTWEDWIDWIEDPTSFHASSWAHFQKRTGLRLAVDRLPDEKISEVDKENASIWIIKPAVQDALFLSNQAAKKEIPICFTSYLDHPLGQLSAAKVAQEISSDSRYEVRSCGLLTHQVYHQFDTAQWPQVNGPFLLPATGGTGFGLDDYLQNIQWKRLED